MLRLSLSLWLSFISIPFPIFRVRNPSRQSNVANQVCVSQPVRYGMWSSFQDAPCRKLAQTLLVPLVGHAAWLPCYLGASSRPNPADHYVRKRSITCAFFLSVLCRKSDTTSRLAAQWEKCPKPLYGNYVHIYMRMSNGGQRTGSKVAMQLSNIMSAPTGHETLMVFPTEEARKNTKEKQ